jgi:Trehalose-phosphatase
VQHVRGQIEVVPVRLHKGVVAKTILRTVLQKGGGYPDFVLCVGDDVSDEHMFTSVYSFLADVDAEGGAGADSPTVGPTAGATVGDGASQGGGQLPPLQGDVSPWGATDSSSSSSSTGPADELRLYICTVGKKVCACYFIVYSEIVLLYTVVTLEVVDVRQGFTWRSSLHNTLLTRHSMLIAVC